MTELAALRDKIERHVPHVGRRPYSAHIIATALCLIERDYGSAEANNAIEDFGLDTLGWSKVELGAVERAPDATQARVENYRKELRGVIAQLAELAEAAEPDEIEEALNKAATILRGIRALRESKGRLVGVDRGR